MLVNKMMFLSTNHLVLGRFLMDASDEEDPSLDGPLGTGFVAILLQGWILWLVAHYTNSTVKLLSLTKL